MADHVFAECFAFVSRMLGGWETDGNQKERETNGNPIYGRQLGCSRTAGALEFEAKN